MSLTQDKHEVLKSSKYAILITIGFFLVTACVSFFYHDFWTIFDQDGLIYLSGGQQIIAGVGENVSFPNAGPGGPVVFALLESVLKDGLVATKIVSILSGTGIVFFSYMVFKNIFSSKIALVGQLFIAFNPWIGILSISSVNDLFPIFMSIFSLYFITKKDMKLTDVIFSGAILGVGFMFRSQPAIFLLAIIIFLILLRKTPKFKISTVAVLILFFVLCCSPMLSYNYTTQEKLIDSNSNYYVATHSKYYTQEWKDLLLDNMDKDSNVIFSNHDLFIKNYFYNIFYKQPASLFGFENKVSASLIPAIPILGAIPVLGGLIYSLKIPASKKTLMTVMATAAITTAFVFLLGNFQDHFFAIIIMPLIIIGILNIKNIDRNFIPLLLMPIFFSLAISIIPVRGPHHFLFIWISIAALSAIFFTKMIPEMYKLRNSINKRKFKINYSIKVVLILLFVLFIFINITYSYIQLRILSTDESFVSIQDELRRIQENEPFEKVGIEIKEISDVLAKEPGIENSFVGGSLVYAAYLDSNRVFFSYSEGPDKDTIENYITRKNWSSYDIHYSNLHSWPLDRHDKYNNLPDYLIYPPSENYHDYLKKLENPDNPEIPSNFELIYKGSRGTMVYKISHNEGNDV